MYHLNTTSVFAVPSPSASEPTYIYDIIPISNGLIGALSSDDCLRIVDPVDLGRGAVSVVKAVGKDATALKVVSEDVIAAAGRDGVLGLWDWRNGGKAGEVRSLDNAPILSLASSSPYGLAAGTELTNHQATISIWDLRQLDKPVVQYVESHSDDVTELQFHPTRPQILLSGSTDGLVNIYNTTITDEEEALHQTINHGSSIHHASFISETDIFALSHDEKFSMYELVTNPEEGVEEPPPVHFGDLREKLGGEYVANVVGRPGGEAVIGIGTHSRESFDLVHLKNSPPWSLSPESKVTLLGAHGSDIVRSFCFLDAHQTVLTCGEDGQIKAWKGE